MNALRNADMILPDGAPVAWIMRLRGAEISQRVCGPDIMLALCERSVSEGWRHYFYGGTEGTAEALGRAMQKKYPGLKIAGFDCPPFRSLTSIEIEASIDRINAAKPDLVWIGLGCPKQELWMAEHRSRINGAVLLGVGAAFDFHSGRVQRAPVWMRTYGLEWLHRLISEPTRLWRRYLIAAPRFCVASLTEAVRLKLISR
jgi:N-acetylglucosaminyldiphosphoundecaprenol N-acetyl-beta-D-mannosaminyltransferase